MPGTDDLIVELGIIEKTLRHLGLWDIRNHDPPKPDSPDNSELVYDVSDSRLPGFDYWNTYTIVTAIPKHIFNNGYPAEIHCLGDLIRKTRMDNELVPGR